MIYLLLAFALGSYSSVLWPALPAPVAPVAALALGLAALPWRRARALTLVLVGAAAGVLWATLWGQERLATQLPVALDRAEFRVVGTVVGLPDRDSRALHFELQVARVEALSGAVPPPLRRLRLSWYGDAPALMPGETWQLQLRLRHPRGFANPAGFDRTGWLFSRGVSATGYVRDGAADANRRLSGATPLAVDAWRERIAAHIERLDLPDAGRALLRAFTVGDSRAITTEMWGRMRVAGVIHLAVISGLHIALAAALGLFLGTAAGRLMVALGAPWPARHSGAVTAWIAGGIYTLLAGFGIATLRAFLMLTVFTAVFLLRRHRVLFADLVWALAAVAVIEPLAPLDPGFWLSFGAVAVLLAAFGPLRRRSRLRDLVAAQGIVSLGTAAGLLGFFGKLPLLAPLLNLLAIPWVEFFTVPFCLAGVIALPLVPAVADGFWWIAAWSLQGFDAALAALADLASRANWTPAAGTGWPQVMALTLAGLLMLAPRGLGGKALGGILLAAVVLAGAGARPALRVTVLDVGQGLAVVVETSAHVLVYDTGPAYGDRFDAGDGIIAPYLRSRGWSSLDLLVVSHPDADHSGGEAGLVRNYRPARLLRGVLPAGLEPEAEACRRGQNWRWDGVDFRVLGPDSAGGDVRINDRSCVLLVESQGVRVLLPGDLEADGEAGLLAADLLPSGIDLLLAPHHGSRTSSSPAFVAQLRPAHVVYSAGWHHRFGHPRPQVVARYTAVGARNWNTAGEGALVFSWEAHGGDMQLRIQGARRDRLRYWDRD